MTARELLKFDVDLDTMTVRVGVLPSPFSLESARVTQVMSIPEFQDLSARLTIGYNEHCRQLAAKMRGRRTAAAGT